MYSLVNLTRFLATSSYFFPSRPKNSGRKASVPEITAADPHLVPRQSPKPTLTKVSSTSLPKSRGGNQNTSKCLKSLSSY